MKQAASPEIHATTLSAPPPVHPLMARPAPLLLLSAALVALAGCGGGDGGGSSSDSDSAQSSGGTTTALSVAGTVASSAAMANAAVSLKCVGGNGVATTGTDGRYSVTLAAGAALPCVLAATTASETLHSLATGSGSAVHANITPATDLVVAQLSGSVPATYYAGYDGSSNAAAALSSSAVAAASTAVLATLKAGGVDFGSSGDLIGGELAAGSGGNAYGQALVALSNAMTSSGTTQAALQSAVAQGSGNAPAATLSNTASLPADLLLKAKAPNCGSLRSGTYRAVDFSAYRDESTPSDTFTLDAATLKVTMGVGEPVTLVPAGTCRYQMDGLDVAVSAAGVLVMRGMGDDYSASNHYLSIAFPEQSHTLAELAGDWNTISYDRDTDGAPLTLRTATATIDANGKVPGILSCVSLTGTCTAATEAERAALMLSLNASGGFTFTGNGWTDRTFAYRAGGGELMAVSVNGSGGITLLTRKVARTAPTVGTVSDSLNYYTSPIATAPWLLSMQAADLARSTVVSVDTAQSRWVRDAVFNFTTGATVPQTIVYNNPRDGYLRRLPATNVTRSDGSVGNVTEWVGLPMRGMGFNAVGLTADNRLILTPVLGE